jgi:hypothetical protein
MRIGYLYVITQTNPPCIRREIAAWCRAANDSAAPCGTVRRREEKNGHGHRQMV